MPSVLANAIRTHVAGRRLNSVAFWTRTVSYFPLKEPLVSDSGFTYTDNDYESYGGLLPFGPRSPTAMLNRAATLSGSTYA
eukprot:8335741-Heterocapsa_arctica.AAC.1